MEQPKSSDLLVSDIDLINKYAASLVGALARRFTAEDSKELQQRTRELREKFAECYAARLRELPPAQRYDFAMVFEDKLRETWDAEVFHKDSRHIASFDKGYRRLLAAMTIPAATKPADTPPPVSDPNVRKDLRAVLTSDTLITRSPDAELGEGALTIREREAVRTLVWDFTSRLAGAVSGAYSPGVQAAAADVTNRSGRTLMELYMKRPAEQRAKTLALLQSEVLAIALPRMAEYARNGAFTVEQRRVYDSYLPELLRAMHLGS